MIPLWRTDPAGASSMTGRRLAWVRFAAVFLHLLVGLMHWDNPTSDTADAIGFVFLVASVLSWALLIGGVLLQRTLAELGHAVLVPVVLSGAAIGFVPGLIVSPILPMTGGSPIVSPMTATVGGAVDAALTWIPMKLIAPKSLVTPRHVLP